MTAPRGREPALASAVYEGIVVHRRHAPRAHEFRYRIAQLYLDLDELDRVFAGRWLWSIDRPNLAEFRRRDFLGPPELPLAEAVRALAARAGGARPEGPIRLLAHLRFGGHSFNPVSFYFCHADALATEPASIVAEITNTPWHERHAYTLDVKNATRTGNRLHWSFDKAFHVSPFLPMARQYEWSFTPPGATLGVHMSVRDGERTEFEATMHLVRRPLDAASLRRVLLHYPLMGAQVVTAIYWQAFRLWLKGTPFYPHPNRVRP